MTDSDDDCDDEERAGGGDSAGVSTVPIMALLVMTVIQ
jgi:hypothetical protein